MVNMFLCTCARFEYNQVRIEMTAKKSRRGFWPCGCFFHLAAITYGPSRAGIRLQTSYAEAWTRQ